MSTTKKASHVRSAYQFIKTHRKEFSVQLMCEVLEVAPSGYYAWIHRPNLIERLKMRACYD